MHNNLNQKKKQREHYMTKASNTHGTSFEKSEESNRNINNYSIKSNRNIDKLKLQKQLQLLNLIS